MKKLSDIVGDFVSIVPRCSSEKIIFHVMGKRLETPIPASEVKCPFCQGDDGYFIPDGKHWCCRKISCFEKGLPSDWKPGEKAFQQREKPPILCGIPEAYKHANFTICDQSFASREILSEFCQDFKGFLLLAGPSGTGKTFAACACVNEFLKVSESVLFQNIAELYVKWLGERRDGNQEAFMIEGLISKKLLVFDDLGTRTPTEAFLDFLYLIFNLRSNDQQLGTIITTNFTSQEMNEKLGAAIFSRVASGKIVKFSGKDRRITNF